MSQYEHLFEGNKKSDKLLKTEARILGRRANAADAAFLGEMGSESAYDIAMENGSLAAIMCDMYAEHQDNILRCLETTLLETAPWIVTDVESGQTFIRSLVYAIQNDEDDKTQPLRIAAKCIRFANDADGAEIAAAVAEKWPNREAAGPETEKSVEDFWTAAFASGQNVPEIWKTDAMRVAEACREGTGIFDALDRFADNDVPRRPFLKKILECDPAVFRMLPEKLRSPDFISVAVRDLDNVFEIPKECLTLSGVQEMLRKRLDELPRGGCPTMLQDLYNLGLGPSEMFVDLLDALVACDRQNFLQLLLLAKNDPETYAPLLLRETAIHARCEKDESIAYSDAKTAFTTLGLTIAPSDDDERCRYFSKSVPDIRRALCANLWAVIEDDAEVLSEFRKSKLLPDYIHAALSNPLQTPALPLAAEAYRMLQHGQLRDDIVDMTAARLASGAYDPANLVEYFPTNAFTNPEIADRFVRSCPRIVLETPLLQNDEWMDLAASFDPEIESAYARQTADNSCPMC